MKIKSVNNLNAGNVLTEQELKSIIGGASFTCICTYYDTVVYQFQTTNEASCDSGVCNKHCPQSGGCDFKVIKNSGSDAASGSGSGFGSGFGSDFGSF